MDRVARAESQSVSCVGKMSVLHGGRKERKDAPRPRSSFLRLGKVAEVDEKGLAAWKTDILCVTECKVGRVGR